MRRQLSRIRCGGLNRNAHCLYMVACVSPVCGIIQQITMITQTDYLIVGAGINGMLTARFLAQAGKQVTLIERGEPGRESSWAGGGIVSSSLPVALHSGSDCSCILGPGILSRTGSRAGDAETGIDVECRQTGLLMLDAADRDAALAWAQNNGRVMQQARPGGNPGPGTSAWPGVPVGDFRMPQIANVRNPRLCRRRWLSPCRQVPRYSSGQVSRPRISMSPAGRLPGFGSPVTTRLGTPSSKRHVSLSCSGAWSAAVPLSRLGVNLAVQPVKGEMLLYKFPKPPGRRALFSPGVAILFRVPTATACWRSGHAWNMPISTNPLPMLRARARSDSATALLPVLQDQTPLQQWAGLRPGSGDGIPFIGKLKRWDNLFVNAGQFRNDAWCPAPASARLLSDLALGGPPIAAAGTLRT